MKEEYVPSEYIDKYLKYLEFERKLSNNTIKSYFNDLKNFDLFFEIISFLLFYSFLIHMKIFLI